MMLAFYFLHRAHRFPRLQAQTNGGRPSRHRLRIGLSPRELEADAKAEAEGVVPSVEPSGGLFGNCRSFNTSASRNSRRKNENSTFVVQRRLGGSLDCLWMLLLRGISDMRFNQPVLPVASAASDSATGALSRVSRVDSITRIDFHCPERNRSRNPSPSTMIMTVQDVQSR